jgi:hypothetical protein
MVFYAISAVRQLSWQKQIIKVLLQPHGPSVLKIGEAWWNIFRTLMTLLSESVQFLRMSLIWGQEKFDFIHIVARYSSMINFYQVLSTLNLAEILVSAGNFKLLWIYLVELLSVDSSKNKIYILYFQPSCPCGWTLLVKSKTYWLLQLTPTSSILDRPLLFKKHSRSSVL